MLVVGERRGAHSLIQAQWNAPKEGAHRALHHCAQVIHRARQAEAYEVVAWMRWTKGNSVEAEKDLQEVCFLD